MNARLTKELRNEIVKNASRNLFVKEENDLLEHEKNLGDQLFNKHIAKPEQYALMKKLPAEFFSSDDMIPCSADDMRYFNVKMSEFRRLPAFACGYAKVKVTDTTWLKEYVKLQDEKEALNDQKAELMVQIRQVVLSVNTVNKLLEVWPEAKPFIPAHAFLGGTANVPAVLVANLTAAMMQAGVNFGEVENA